MPGKKEKDLIKKIKLAMLEKGLNQSSLARKLGLSHTAVNAWLHGKSTPSLDALENVANATEKPLNYFFDNSPVGDGNQIINGSHNQTCNNKDYALILAKIATLESKVENLELKYDLLKKQK